MNKITIYLLAIITMVNSCSSCKKDTVDSNGLPAATQTGANTFGFMLNGQPWKPQGMIGISPNYTINVDEGYFNGIFNITAYKILNNNSNTEQSIGLGLSDSLRFLKNTPANFNLYNHSLFDISFINNNGCIYTQSDSTITRSGLLTITKFDNLNRIIAGTFNAVLIKRGCDTIKITDGRFDMKF